MSAAALTTRERRRLVHALDQRAHAEGVFDEEARRAKRRFATEAS